MNIRRKTEKGIATIWFLNQCDLLTCLTDEYRVLCAALSDSKVEKVVVDMANVGECSIKAIDMFTSCATIAAGLDKELVMKNASKTLMDEVKPKDVSSILEEVEKEE